MVASNCGTDTWFCSDAMSKWHKLWTEEEDQYMRDNYPNNRTADVAKKIGRTHGSVVGRAKVLGLRKSEEFMRSSKSGRHIQGQTPWNKGKRVYLSECGTKYIRKPKGALPIGSISFNKANHQWHIKVMDSPNMNKAWRPYPEYVWKNAGMDVPSGFVVAFKQGFKPNHVDDITLDKLEVISRQELLDRNRIQRYPSELHSAMIQIGLMRKELDEDDK